MNLPVTHNTPDPSGLAEASCPSVPPRFPAVEISGLYVHVPFCFHKCHYCDFYSITRQPLERMERFVDLILQEAAGWSRTARGPLVRPKTVFFGGGTPSLLPLAAMQRLLQGLQELFDFSALDEWTVEANPATLTPDFGAMLITHGVNRLSFGAQSFSAAELKVLERHHQPADVSHSIQMARDAGFRRLNVDLIYGIPGQDLSSWQHSLESALAMQIEHISCYALTYEPNTPIAVKKRLGHIQPVEESVELAMLHATRRRLIDAGYPPYEISNYARPGEECRHNLLYWNGGSYIGLGPSAASHVQGWRWKNRPHLSEWEQAVAAGGIPAADLEQLTPRHRAAELVMLQLRLSRGVRFAEFMAQTGFDARELFPSQLSQLPSLDLLHIDSQGFRLTESGLNVADAIAGEFLQSV
jgi:oxygen-independent coproporphyrinogen-3 oxidase